MLMRFLVSILLFTVSCQTTSACICTRQQHAGNSAIELIVSPVNPVDGENVCFCCYSKITRTVRTVYFYRNGDRVCEVKDSGPVNWEDGNFTCKRVNGTLTVFEVNPTEFNISGITCQNEPNVRRREKASVQGLPHIKEQKWKDFRNRTVENTTTYNLTSFSNSTKFNNLTTFKISTSTVKDSNWVIPVHVSLASFGLIIVAQIILVVLLILVKKIIHSLKLKRYKRTSIQRIDNELMNTTLQISSSMESHIYESIADLAVTPGIKQPCTSPGTRARSDSPVVADLPKVTNLGIPYKSNPVSQRHDTENENESSPFLQNNCQDNHHKSYMNITTLVTYKFPPESDLSGNDCPQINACLRKSSKNCVRNPILNDDYLTPIHLSNSNVSVSSLKIASNPDHS
ncbi:hypothetical protein SNE40_021814 [Patella caerulea]|uniref:Uncharacterized protein n=1 Tax=Patella caerulea TaxID=87958 RepID=A0AAN8J4D2_PATCE